MDFSLSEAPYAKNFGYNFLNKITPFTAILLMFLAVVVEDTLYSGISSGICLARLCSPRFSLSGFYVDWGDFIF